MKNILTLLALTILMGASAATAQNHNITAPSGDGWTVPATANKGEKVTIKYTGTNKYVKNVKIVPLPTTVTITPSCLTSMAIGETATLQADIYPNLDAVDKTVTWEITEGNSVSIGEDGKVKATREGKTTVTVTTNKNNKTSQVTIDVVAPSNTFVQKAFSVSSKKKIVFSKGNLQYNVNEKKWRFANHQWDYVGGSGTNAGNMGCNTNVGAAGPWIDLFGWGTWTKNGIEPNSTSTTTADYKTGVESSGGDFENVCKEGIESGWQTLSYNEWYYLQYTRDNAPKLRGVATVNGVNGLIILPDEFEDPKPDGVEFTSGVASSDGRDYYKTVNEYTATQWVEMEKSGAVFLPAAGGRIGTSVSSVGYNGGYWSSTDYDTANARGLYFYSRSVNAYGSDGRWWGRSVRLVRSL